MINFNPFPVIETERLLLRAFEVTDADTLLQLRSDDIVNQFINRDKPQSIDDITVFMQRIWNNANTNVSIMWGICIKGDVNNLIGTICLWNFSEDRTVAEIGYDMFPVYHGKGYMNEAMKKVLDFAFKTGFKTVEAFTHRNNEKSIALLKRNGFASIPERKDEDNVDNIIFTLPVSKGNE